MKTVFLITTFLISNTLFSQRNKEYKSWQFYIGKTAFEITDTWDVGMNRYFAKGKKVFKLGFDLGWHHYKYVTTIDTNNKYQLIPLPSAPAIQTVTQKQQDNFIRLKPFASIGYKIISKKKYSTDLSFTTGLGLNLWRKIISQYYELDSLGYTEGALIINDQRGKDYTFFRKSDLFLGIENSHFFQIKKSGQLFFNYLIGLDFCLYNNPMKAYYNHFFFQAKLGFSFPE